MLRRESQYSTSAFNCESWVTPLTAIYLFVCYHQSSKSHSSIETKLPKRFCLLLPLRSNGFQVNCTRNAISHTVKYNFPGKNQDMPKKIYQMDVGSTAHGMQFCTVKIMSNVMLLRPLGKSASKWRKWWCTGISFHNGELNFAHWPERLSMWHIFSSSLITSTRNFHASFTFFWPQQRSLASIKEAAFCIQHAERARGSFKKKFWFMYNGEIGANNLLSIVGWHRYKQRLNATGASSPVQKTSPKTWWFVRPYKGKCWGNRVTSVWTNNAGLFALFVAVCTSPPREVMLVKPMDGRN